MKINPKFVIWMISLFLLTTIAASANDGVLVRVKDIARVQGVQDNQLYGLGLVIGLTARGTEVPLQIYK